MFEFNATFIVAIFSFVVFILIMNAIFYNPILSIMKARQQYIDDNYNTAKAFNSSSEEIIENRNNQIAQVQDNSRKVIKTAIDKAHEIATKEVQKAREDNKFEIQKQKELLQQKETVLKENLKNDVISDLSSIIVSKIIGKETIIDNFNKDKVDEILG